MITEQRARLERTLHQDADQAIPCRAISELLPESAREAQALDHREPSDRGPLHGWTVAVKECIATGTPATAHAGTPALENLRLPAEAEIVQRLRANDALIAGRSRMSEWSGMRSTMAPSGWSTLGGQVGNGRDSTRSPWGSSSGSAAAVAAGWVRLGIGTDTSGSITLPAAANGVVGFRPTLGRLPTTGVVPISPAQDTVGLLTATADDAFSAARALLDGWREPSPQAPRAAWLTDPGADPPDAHLPDECREALVQALTALTFTTSPEVTSLANSDQELDLLVAEFGIELRLLLATHGRALKITTPSELLRVCREHPQSRWDELGADLLERACSADDELCTSAATYRTELRHRAQQALTDCLRKDGTGLMLATITGGAWTLPRVPDPAQPLPTVVPCIAGWPQVCLPARTGPEPVGLLLTGPPGSDEQLLALAVRIESGVARD